MSGIALLPARQWTGMKKSVICVREWRSQFNDVIFPGAFRVWSDCFRFVVEEPVNSLGGAWPARIPIFIEHDYATRLDLVVKDIQRELVGLMEIAVEMQQGDV